MKALIYLIKRTAANNLKKAVRKPTTLLALIFGAAYGIFLIVMLGTLAVTVRIDSVQGLVILVTVWTIYITVGNFMSYASRKGILFRPAHSQFVFPAPISPKLVLIQGAWMNYLMSFFIWIVLAIGGLTVFHVEWWKMLFFFLIGCGVECAVEQSVMIILYTNDKLPQKLIKGICFGMKVFLIAFTLMIVLYFKEKGLSVESALSFINWPVLQMIPVVGWQIAVYRLVLLGPTTLNVICTVIYSVFTVFIVAAAKDGKLLVVLLCQFFASDNHGSAGGSVQPAHHVKQGGLAATRGSHNSHKLAVLHGEIYAVKGAGNVRFCTVILFQVNRL